MWSPNSLHAESALQGTYVALMSVIDANVFSTSNANCSQGCLLITHNLCILRSALRLFMRAI